MINLDIPKLTDDLNIIQSLQDQPTLSSQELKAKFDEGSNLIKDYINKLFLPKLQDTLEDNLQTMKDEIDKKLENVDKVLEKDYPVGSLKITDLSDNPSSYLGFGTWELIAKGRTIVGYDSTDEDFNKATKIGGSKEIVLKEENIPAHKHGGVVTNVNVEISAQYDRTLNQYAVSNTTVTKGSTSLAGNGKAFNNMNPYYVTYIWKRIA